MLFYHPAFAVLCISLPMLCPLIVIPLMFDRGEEYETYKNQIAITDTQLAFGETKSTKTVAVIGTVKNTSAIPWKEVQFHAVFFDSTGKRIDVGSKEQHSYVLPANGMASFKVSFPMEFPETNYVKAAVNISMAKDARSMW